MHSTRDPQYVCHILQVVLVSFHWWLHIFQPTSIELWRPWRIHVPLGFSKRVVSKLHGFEIESLNNIFASKFSFYQVVAHMLLMGMWNMSSIMLSCQFNKKKLQQLELQQPSRMWWLQQQSWIFLFLFFLFQKLGS
jgi:hypothetical protein